MIPAHAQPEYSTATATPPWEVETGASVINNDNGWLLSFIDILALLLTLFVLLLAYEADGPDAGNTTSPVLQPQSPVLQPQVVQPDITPPSDNHASHEPSQVPVPFPVFDSPGLPAERSLPQLRRAAPGVIDLPIAVAVEYRRALPASEMALPEAAQAASAGRIDVPAEGLPETPLELPPAAEPALASQPLPANVSAAGLQGAPVSTPSAVASVSPQDALLAALASSGLQERVEVTLHSGGVNLEISDSILFMPASAALTADGSGLLGELAATLAEHPLRLSVEGHTDNIPIQTDRYPSNWELSSARAAAVTRQLIERGVAADRIRAIGYGDTRARADNDTSEGRARNRRVSFVLQLPSQTPAGAAD